ncbi:glycosyl transferase family 2 [Acinetobacter sp. Ac_877]|uniref:glycosyltransferase family 2 protein n=1 Tax=Acinetobacter portensis TaxID=1839785 RepID=UPI00128E2E23|nr:glycosyltransferase family 2 protein [Acinetobacter portensis]MPW42074.1 glycosyl transferase family 2 [Acinetobacter portensis]
MLTKNNDVLDNRGIELSIILPAYNDAKNVDLLLPLLFTMLAKKQVNCEIILVDDGGKDNLYEVYEKHLNLTPINIEFNLIQFSRNFGKEAALSAGLKESQGKLVAMMDSDGQHPLSVLEEMLEAIQNPAIDMVAAVQETREHENILLKLYKHVFYRFMQDSQRYKLEPHAGDFRVMKRKVVDSLLALPERQRFMKGLYSWVGFKTLYLPFQAQERLEGTSSFNFSGLFELAVIGVTSFSLKPLRWITRMGFLVSVIAILYGLFIIGDTLFFGKDLKGWPTLAVGIMFSAGLQLICLGVIGEYIGRIYDEVKQRPLYIVDKKWNNKKQDQ